MWKCCESNGCVMHWPFSTNTHSVTHHNWTYDESLSLEATAGVLTWAHI